MPATLLDKVERLEDEGPIDQASVDFTIEQPDLVRETVGHPLVFGETVEIEVPTTADVVRTILPNMHPLGVRFVDIWDIQETEHGGLLRVPRQQCDIEPLPTRDTVPSLMKFVGMVARVSPGMHDVTEMVYYTEGALGEQETLYFYNSMKTRLRDIGEVPLSRLVQRIAAQEASHLAFYMQASREKRETLNERQLRFVQRFVEKTYMPVGVRISRRDIERQRQFGEAAQVITDGEPAKVTDSVETLARDLLAIVSDDPNPFLRRRYEHCIEEYKDSVAV